MYDNFNIYIAWDEKIKYIAISLGISPVTNCKWVKGKL